MDTQSVTLIICSECGEGHYSRSPLTGSVRCEHCDHHIYSGDVVLDPGETLAWAGGRLGYTMGGE